MRDDFIYGVHVVRKWIETQPESILEIFYQSSQADQRIQAILQCAAQHNLSTQLVSKKQLNNWLPSACHQGVAARIRLDAIKSAANLKLSDIIQNATTSPFLLILDGIQDPHNLGACLRTANAVGVDAVIIPKDRSASVTPAVRKVASGAAETMPIISVTNLVRALEELKQLGVWIVGTSIKATQSLYHVDFQCPTAIVMGSEGTGLRRLTEAHCDVLMKIPMMGSVESLNVSVAAAVCLYEVLRQRTQQKTW